MARRTTTRERLVTTASELFARQGYGQTGVNAIMRSAGATSGSFYHFFATKEDLLLAVLDHEAERQEHIFSAAEKAGDDPASRLRSLLAAYRADLIRTKFAAGSLLGAASAELAASHPAVRARIDELYTARAARLATLLGGASTDLTRLIIAAIDGAILQARASHGAAPFDAVAAELELRVEPPTASPKRRRRAASAPIPPPRPDPPRRRPRPADWRAW